QGVAQRARRDAAVEDLADTGDVAGRLGHLRSARLEVGAVEPGSDERLPGGRLALRDLVLVMGEDQVDAARVDVERRPEMLHRHRRALDVPARATRADRGVPGWLARLRALPEGEVADVVLGVLVGLDAFADPHLIGVG